MMVYSVLFIHVNIYYFEPQYDGFFATRFNETS